MPRRGRYRGTSLWERTWEDKPAAAGLTADDTALWARLNGVFWAAFLLFSWTAGSILSGAVIERIRSAAFWMLASARRLRDLGDRLPPGAGRKIGWMVKVLGYHDAYASGVIHGVAGGSALAIFDPSGATDRPLSTGRIAAYHPPHTMCGSWRSACF